MILQGVYDKGVGQNGYLCTLRISRGKLSVVFLNLPIDERGVRLFECLDVKDLGRYEHLDRLHRTKFFSDWDGEWLSIHVPFDSKMWVIKEASGESHRPIFCHKSWSKEKDNRFYFGGLYDSFASMDEHYYNYLLEYIIHPDYYGERTQKIFVRLNLWQKFLLKMQNLLYR